METFTEEKRRIIFEGGFLDAVLSIPCGQSTPKHTAVVLNHGAGGDMNHQHLLTLARTLASAGVLCMRFTCKGLNLTYRMKAYTLALEDLRRTPYTLKNIFLGGRSMGSRAAAALVRQMQGDESIRGLICLSFPLHPIGQEHKYQERSVDLLGLATVPVLFVSGTSDNMCQRNLLEEVTEQMKAPVSIHWVESANHYLQVKGKTEEAVLADVNNTVLVWIMEHV